MLAARVEPKNGPKENKKIGNFKPLVLSEFQPAVDTQQKEGTIDSQITELKRQIAAAGHVLVKEYIDDGYSGAELTRPGLRQLLEEAKSDSFKVIYFLAHDRIARDVAHQIPEPEHGS